MNQYINMDLVILLKYLILMIEKKYSRLLMRLIRVLISEEIFEEDNNYDLINVLNKEITDDDIKNVYSKMSK